MLPFHSSYTTTVTEGDRMILHCQAAGIPRPVVYWSRTGGSSSLIRNYGISKPVSNGLLMPIANAFCQVSILFFRDREKQLTSHLFCRRTQESTCVLLKIGWASTTGQLGSRFDVSVWVDQVILALRQA